MYNCGQVSMMPALRTGSAGVALLNTVGMLLGALLLLTIGLYEEELVSLLGEPQHPH